MAGLPTWERHETEVILPRNLQHERTAKMAGIPVTIIGELYYSSLGIGGGPIMPPAQPPGVVSPPIYYPPVFPAHPIAPGGPPPVATPPIYYPPVFPAHPIAPGGPPPTVMPPIYYPPVFPAHPIAPGGPPPTVSPPIYYPPDPAHPIVLPPAPPEGGPPPEGGWAYSPVYGWVWVPSGGGGKPKPPDLPVPPTEPPPVDPNAPVVTPHT